MKWQSAAEQFHDHPTLWWEAIGVPLGLGRYKVRALEVDRILDEFESFYRSYSAPSNLFAPVEPAEAQSLMALLERWGPLQWVNGVVGDGRGFEGFHSVSLHQYRLLLRALVGTRDLLQAPKSRTQARRRALATLKGAHGLSTREVQVDVELRRGTVRYVTRAASLNAVLWNSLILKSGRSDQGICRYCGAKFDSPDVRRGRPPEYCPEHRGSRYRDAVLRGSAPAEPTNTLSEAIFDLEDEEDDD